MSLEAALDRHTEVVSKLIALIEGGKAVVVNKAADAPAPAAAAAPAPAEAPAKRGPGRPPKAPPAAAAPAPEPAPPPPPAAPAATFDEVKAALLKLKEVKGAPAAQEVIKTAGGVGKMAEIPPAKFGAVLAAVQAILEPEDDEDALIGSDEL